MRAMVKEGDIIECFFIRGARLLGRAPRAPVLVDEPFLVVLRSASFLLFVGTDDCSISCTCRRTVR